MQKAIKLRRFSGKDCVDSAEPCNGKRNKKMHLWLQRRDIEKLDHAKRFIKQNPNAHFAEEM